MKNGTKAVVKAVATADPATVTKAGHKAVLKAAHKAVTKAKRPEKTNVTTVNILLCGVGGQGSILASKLIAIAAMDRHLNVRSAETIGMAQRGGSVVSHVRIGETIWAPMISRGQADVIIAFEPGEAMRNLDFLKEDGCLVTCAEAVMPVTASLGVGHYNREDTLSCLKKRVKNLYLVDGETICRECGSPKVLNTALLGAAAKSGKVGLTRGELEKAVRKRLPEKLHAMNLKAMKLGYGTDPE